MQTQQRQTTTTPPAPTYQPNTLLAKAISTFQRAGGTYGVALSLLNSAYGRGEHARQPTILNIPDRHKPGYPKRRGASDRVQAMMAKSLFDTTILPDGRSLREVRWSECPKLIDQLTKSARERTTLAYILDACYKSGVPAEDTTLDNVVTEKKLGKYIDAAKEKAAA